MTDRFRDLENIDSTTLIRIISLKLKLKTEHEMKKLGINAAQGRTLSYIHKHQNDGLIQKDIADAFNKKSATITSMLQGLEKKGYIERRIQKDNERQKNIYLLEKGEKLIEDANTIFSNVTDEVSNIITREEEEELNKILSKINKALPDRWIDTFNER